VDQRRVGQRVAIEPGIPDGTCEQCRRGRYNLCPDMQYFGTPPIDGALANYVVVPDAFAYALPKSMSDEEGALIEPLSVALWACRKAHLQGGEHVLVTGAGPIGLLVMKVALALGVADVAISDVHPQRLAIAGEHGAARTVNVAEGTLESAGVQADVLFECSGTQPALMDGIRALRPAGVAVVVGMSPGDALSVPMSFIQNREITLTGTFRFANTYADAISMVASGRIDVRSVITGRYPLHEAEQALQATQQDPTNIKSIVAPS
jgi:L-iditol 2-dehydrogenase